MLRTILIKKKNAVSTQWKNAQQHMMKWLEEKRQKGELRNIRWGQIPLQQTGEEATKVQAR